MVYLCVQEPKLLAPIPRCADVFVVMCLKCWMGKNSVMRSIKFVVKRIDELPAIKWALEIIRKDVKLNVPATFCLDFTFCWLVAPTLPLSVSTPSILFRRLHSRSLLTHSNSHRIKQSKILCVGIRRAAVSLCLPKKARTHKTLMDMSILMYIIRKWHNF